MDNDALIKFIEDNLNLKMKMERVGNQRCYSSFNLNLPTDNYNSLTFAQCINFYKISRMKELGLISEDVRKELSELYNQYLKICSRIGEEGLNDKIFNLQQMLDNELIKQFENKSISK